MLLLFPLLYFTGKASFWALRSPTFAVAAVHISLSIELTAEDNEMIVFESMAFIHFDSGRCFTKLV